MLRVAILAFAVLWAVSTVGRFSRRWGRMPRTPAGGARPSTAKPEPRSDRLISVLRMVIGVLLVIAFATALFALTDLTEVAVVLVAAPVAGLVASLITERLVTEDDG